MIDEIKLTKPNARKLMVISHHKKTGKVVYEEGEELPYVAKKLGFQCTNTGVIVASACELLVRLETVSMVALLCCDRGPHLEFRYWL